MRGTVVLATIVLVASVAANAGSAERDFKADSEPDGFRGIRWGTNIETLTGMTKTGTEPSVGGVEDKYTKANEDLQIGEATLSKIVYGFWRKQLISVQVYAERLGNCEALKEAAFKKFGKGYKPSRFLEEYFWEGPVTWMFYKPIGMRKQGCVINMSSTKLAEEAQQYDKERGKEDTEKGF